MVHEQKVKHPVREVNKLLESYAALDSFKDPASRDSERVVQALMKKVPQEPRGVLKNASNGNLNEIKTVIDMLSECQRRLEDGTFAKNDAFNLAASLANVVDYFPSNSGERNIIRALCSHASSFAQNPRLSTPFKPIRGEFDNRSEIAGARLKLALHFLEREYLPYEAKRIPPALAPDAPSPTLQVDYFTRLGIRVEDHTSVNILGRGKSNEGAMIRFIDARSPLHYLLGDGRDLNDLKVTRVGNIQVTDRESFLRALESYQGQQVAFSLTKRGMLGGPGEKVTVAVKLPEFKIYMRPSKGNVKRVDNGFDINQ